MSTPPAVGGPPVSATDGPGADDEVRAEVEVDVETDGAEPDGAEADGAETDGETDVFGDAAPAPEAREAPAGRPDPRDNPRDG